MKAETVPCCEQNKHDWGEANQDVCDACLIEDLQMNAELLKAAHDMASILSQHGPQYGTDIARRWIALRDRTEVETKKHGS